MFLDIESIEHCMQFLNRVDLKGGEVPAFVNVTNRLHHARTALLQEQENAAVERILQSREEAPAPPTE